MENNYSGPPLLTKEHCSSLFSGNQFDLLSPGSIVHGNFVNKYPSALITLDRCYFADLFALFKKVLLSLEIFESKAPSLQHCTTGNLSDAFLWK